MERVLGDVEAARQQHFLDEAVELGDVLVDLRLQLVALGRRRLGEHRHRHLHARQRRAQLVAGVGEQRAVRADERLDARRGDVEARGDSGDLVGPGDLDPMAELAGTELLDALLQRLEAPRQPAHDRIGAGGDGEEEDDEDDGEGEAARQSGQQQRPWTAALVGARAAAAGGAGSAAGPGLSAGTAPAGAHLALSRSHGPQRSSVVELEGEGADDALGDPPIERFRGAEPLPSRIVEGERHTQALRPVAQRLDLHVCGGGGRRQRMAEQLGPGDQALADDLLVADPLVVEMALEHPAGDEREEQQHHHHGGVDAQIEALHRRRAVRPRRRRRPASSRTRSRRRAP